LRWRICHARPGDYIQRSHPANLCCRATSQRAPNSAKSDEELYHPAENVALLLTACVIAAAVIALAERRRSE